MTTLHLRVRYFQDCTPEDIPCREENFVRREFEMALPVEQTALVLVDVWNAHFIESWLERAETVVREAVVPVLERAREVGLAVVHAPSPGVAEQFQHLKRHKPPDPQPEPDWPPATFRRRQGPYAAYRGPRHQPPGVRPIPDLGMSPAIEVREDDFVIATGQQLHDLLKQRGILHLIYAGFATNWCVLGRDYGIRAMSSRGYNVSLLRDATMGVEFPDTLDARFATEIAIREAEQQCGFTASNEDYFAACRDASGK